MEKMDDAGAADESSASERAESIDDGQDDDGDDTVDAAAAGREVENDETGDDDSDISAAGELVATETLDYDEDEEDEPDANNNEAEPIVDDDNTIASAVRNSGTRDSMTEEEDNGNDDSTAPNATTKKADDTEEGEIDDLEEGELKSDADDEEPAVAKIDKKGPPWSSASDDKSRQKPMQPPRLVSPTGMRPEDAGICKFFLRGTCTWGTSCKFIHPAPQACQRWRSADDQDRPSADSPEQLNQPSGMQRTRRGRRGSRRDPISNLEQPQWIPPVFASNLPIPLMQNMIHCPPPPLPPPSTAFPIVPPVPLLAQSVNFAQAMHFDVESAWERGLKQARQLLHKDVHKRNGDSADFMPANRQGQRRSDDAGFESVSADGRQRYDRSISASYSTSAKNYTPMPQTANRLSQRFDRRPEATSTARPPAKRLRMSAEEPCLSISPLGKSPISSDDDEIDVNSSQSPPRAFALPNAGNSVKEFCDPWDRSEKAGCSSSKKRSRDDRSSSDESSRSASSPWRFRNQTRDRSSVTNSGFRRSNNRRSRSPRRFGGPKNRLTNLRDSDSRKVDDGKGKRSESQSEEIFAISPSSAPSDIDDDTVGVVAAPISSDDEVEDAVEKTSDKPTSATSSSPSAINPKISSSSTTKNHHRSSTSRSKSPKEADSQQKEARRAELLRQLQEVEEAIARKRAVKSAADASR